MLEAGTKRPITITWMPPAGYDVCKNCVKLAFEWWTTIKNKYILKNIDDNS